MVVVIMISVPFGIGFDREPALDVGNLAGGVEQAAGKEAIGRCFVRCGIEDGRGRIEPAQPGSEGVAAALMFRRGEEIGLW
jgi:hypothetical protein